MNAQTAIGTPAGRSEYRNRVGVGVADHAEAFHAGRLAVQQAIAAGPPKAPDFALLFSTSRHNPNELHNAVRNALPNGVPVYGGYAVGIISDRTLGYDGYQVGIALFWLDGAKLDVMVGRGLNAGEAAVGNDLVGRLSEHDFAGTPSLLLLYDSVNRTGNSFRLNMATSLIQGSFARLPQTVPLVGAGLVGDMQCRSTFQWTGTAVETQTALLLAFSGNLEIEQVVLHGCKPASAYHEITLVDDNVVLQIDGRPALEAVADLLGPGAERSWRDYAFFVTLGLNKGEKYGSFDPDVYANRMCMSVDVERGGLVMFEPDLREGDLVQLMLRDLDFSYIGNKIHAELEKHAPRKPVFALYVDCAGRASAYSHLDEEEATYVQAALKDICPLLGFYSGVEVARIAGELQALDWTGVLSFFFEREAPTAAAGRLALLPPSAVPRGAPRGKSSSGAIIGEQLAALDYYQDKLDRAAGEQLKFDARLSAMNHRLRQKEEGFRVLANLRTTINVQHTRHELYRAALDMILASMSLDRAVVLERAGTGPTKVVANAGYADTARSRLDGATIVVPEELATADVLIANRRDKSDARERLRDQLEIPCFLAVPIPWTGGRATLVVGREREIKPFYPPFDAGDADNLRAIANFLSSVVDNVQLYGEAERMAASFRRFVPEAFLKIINRTDLKDIALGDQVARHMSVLVTDIRSFTTLSERMTPDQVFAFVNEFLAEVGPVIRQHSGFVNKYIGDAVMALFDEARDGIRSAVSLLKQVDGFNEKRRHQRKFPIQIGVGVNSGDLMLGTIGEAERLEGSVLADAVNLSFRLESLTKSYGAQILTTDETLAELPDGTDFNVRPVDFVTVKGRRNHVTIMEVLDGLPEERLEMKLSTRDLYTSGYQTFEFGAYEEAARIFREVAKLDPDDRAARAMMLKARKLSEGDAYVGERAD